MSAISKEKGSASCSFSLSLCYPTLIPRIRSAVTKIPFFPSFFFPLSHPLFLWGSQPYTHTTQDGIAGRPCCPPDLPYPALLTVLSLSLSLSSLHSVMKENDLLLTSAESILKYWHYDSFNIMNRYIVKNQFRNHFMSHESILFQQKAKMNWFTVLESRNRLSTTENRVFGVGIQKDWPAKNALLHSLTRNAVKHD